MRANPLLAQINETVLGASGAALREMARERAARPAVHPEAAAADATERRRQQAGPQQEEPEEAAGGGGGGPREAETQRTAISPAGGAQEASTA